MTPNGPWNGQAQARRPSGTPVVFDHINLRHQRVPWYRRLLRFLARR